MLLLAVFQIPVVALVVHRVTYRTPAPPPPDNAWAGSASCASCHPAEHAAWKESHHARAQSSARPEGAEAAFAVAPGGLWNGRPVVKAEGAAGTPADHSVAGAIGVDPLVQYLVEFDRGRFQPTALAFDVRKREWFDLHQDEPRRPDDWLHWTNRGMTWNLQCAYCHMTDFRKNFDAANETYASAWREEGVGCEACHGPRAEHGREAVGRWQSAVGRQQAAGDSRPSADSSRQTAEGSPQEAQGGRQSAGGSRQTTGGPEAGPTVGNTTFVARAPDPMLDACAACHARRRQLGEGFVARPGGQEPGNTFLDWFDPVLPDQPAYHADGQVREEDYEWGSFVQSRMHAVGVRCGDCHDPHSGRLRKEGNALCLQCHKPDLDAPAHTFHRAGSEGAQCVACHMPRTTYMLRHPRRDHAFTSPLPELTAAIGLPNACNRCHADRDATWAAEWHGKWYGRKDRPAARRAPVIAAARDGRREAVPGLVGLLEDAAAPTIWRASAASALGGWASDSVDALRALESAAADREPLVRARIARSLANAPEDARRRRLPPLLRDPVRLVRLDAAWSLRGIAPRSLAQADADALERALAEYRDAAVFNADSPAGRLDLAMLHNVRGEQADAEREYRAALRLDRLDLLARYNFASFLSETGRGAEAVGVLEEGATLLPRSPEVHFWLALAYNESGRLNDAIRALETTWRLAPAYPRLHYNLGLAYARAGRHEDARRRITEAIRQDPGNEGLRQLLKDLPKD